MAVQTRIYAVANGSGPTRLVEATSTAQALRHVAEQTFTVAIAKPKDVAALMAQGVTLETAGEEATSA